VSFSIKDWKDDPDTSTPLSAAGLEDLETRLSAYTDTIGATKQPLDSDLTAIAALTTTTFGRALLALADASAGRTALGLGTAATAASTDFQAVDSDLTAIAALSTTSFGRSLLALADSTALAALLPAQSGSAALDTVTVPPPLSPNLWDTTRMIGSPAGGNASGATISTAATLTASRASGGGVVKLTRIPVVKPGSAGSPNAAVPYRITFKLNSTGGTGQLKVAEINGNAPTADSVERTLFKPSSWQPTIVDQWHSFEFYPSPFTTHLDVFIAYANNEVGTMAADSVDVRAIDIPRPFVKVGYGSPNNVTLPGFDASTGATGGELYVDHGFKRHDGRVVRVRSTFGVDGAHKMALTAADAFDSTAYKGEIGNSAGNVSQVGYLSQLFQTPNTQASIHVNNCDEVQVPVLTDGSSEVRGNTHGGEALRDSYSPGVDVIVQFDIGDGVWRSLTSAQYLHNARRVQVTTKTQIQRSDEVTPYCTVDLTYTFFWDGTVRVDRSVTFLRDQILHHWFYWMLSFDNNVAQYRGRVGRRDRVLGEVDYRATLAVPSLPTLGTATTGGSLAAGGYGYKVTAFNGNGETIASDEAQITVPAGTATNTVTVTWAAVTGAAGYRVYGRGRSPFGGLLATVTSGLTFTDDGSGVPNGGAPVPARNTAYTMLMRDDKAQVGQAEWMTYREEITGVCFGLAVDSEDLLGLDGVESYGLEMGHGGGGTKMYTHLVLEAGSDAYAYATNHLVPSGAVFASTMWHFIYLPVAADDFEREIASKADDLAALAEVYTTA
jgi:hypothetical protein